MLVITVISLVPHSKLAFSRDWFVARHQNDFKNHQSLLVMTIQMYINL